MRPGGLRHRGRGALGNPESRYHALHHEVDPDYLEYLRTSQGDTGGQVTEQGDEVAGLGCEAGLAGQQALAECVGNPDRMAAAGSAPEPAAPQSGAGAAVDAACFGIESPRTEVRLQRSVQILSRNQSPDIPFDRSVNPYQGCEHGCIYCYARPSHARLGLSPGLDFETRILAKPQAAALLARELGKAAYQPGVIALGANTDPYQPVEARLGLTRSVLEVLEAHGHPVAIITKSAGILRDRERLARMAERGLVHVWISLAGLDPELARTLEPRAASPARRLQVMGELARLGIAVGVLVAPVIPGLNDTDLERVLAAAAAQGVRHADYVTLRLPLEVEALFTQWLETHHPERARHVLSLHAQLHPAPGSTGAFGTRMKGSGPLAALLSQRMRVACAREGLTRGAATLRTDLFAVPPGPQAQSAQGSLF
jgi:DNA repair photolyase